MSASNSSQKFIARNRAPRVQIEYDVEIYGSEKKVELPFVMGVLADLSGNPLESLPAVTDRRFLDIDIDNFDERMKAIKPRVAFAVPNTLTGEGQLMVDMTFESIEDFSPAAVASKVYSLRQLLDARTQLANLQTYMDGKSGAEALVNNLLADPALLKSLAAAPKPQAEVTTTESDRPASLN
ncbi:type VI secretion system contractile sheath small subunit [Paraburkholderia sp. SOS3]|jgi:type VI secretion system protein ImpB|uniref:type VI secretion system contractile sheath small subunit n=1 Tax=Paraburkholderia sp. SOS3 TaxID=1926494 RepID=UPI00094746E6|nr:type VI secretion system contractile sheath small subunit [Paraburkholderia sp. SOS3]APR38887.1 type VI secretion system-associated protein [Paraburkholderia sp. SOS3]